jgi:hypothetical protein
MSQDIDGIASKENVMASFAVMNRDVTECGEMSKRVQDWKVGGTWAA